MDLDKLNIQGMLDKFKQTKNGLDKTFRDIFSTETEPEPEDIPDEEAAPETEEAAEAETEPVSEAPEDEFPEAAPENMPEPMAESAVLPDLTVIEEKLIYTCTQLDSISKTIDGLKADSAGLSVSDERIIRIMENVNSKVSKTGEKLNDLNASLAGVSKLNDSIFDLKNSQMNTKNALGELEGSFYKLKRKMTTGVMLISILVTIIAILEILNLFS